MMTSEQDYNNFLQSTAKFIGIPVSFFFVLLLQSPRIVNWLTRENIYPTTQAGDYPVIASYCLGAFLSFVLFEFIARSKTTGKNSQEVPANKYFFFKFFANLVFHILIVWPSFFGVLALLFATYHLFFTLQPVHYIMLPVSLVPFLIHLALFIPAKIWHVIPDYVYNNKLDRRKKLEEERQEEKRQEERRAEEESLAQEKTALLTEEKGESAESKKEAEEKLEPQRRRFKKI